jgi:hypothetical protein
MNAVSVTKIEVLAYVTIFRDFCNLKFYVSNKFTYNNNTPN